MHGVEVEEPRTRAPRAKPIMPCHAMPAEEHSEFGTGRPGREMRRPQGFLRRVKGGATASTVNQMTWGSLKSWGDQTARLGRLACLPATVVGRAPAAACIQEQEGSLGRKSDRVLWTRGHAWLGSNAAPQRRRRCMCSHMVLLGAERQWGWLRSEMAHTHTALEADQSGSRESGFDPLLVFQQCPLFPHFSHQEKKKRK